MLNSLKTTFLSRAILAILSIILTFHCANKVILVRIPARVFYPFNILFTFSSFSLNWLYNWIYDDMENYNGNIVI